MTEYKTNISIILQYPDKQQELTLKGRLTHFQYDPPRMGSGTLQLYIKDVDKMDVYERVKVDE